MGVHGLWELLAPVGRRVSVEVLRNRKLAIDASIWIIQFMKAMRDERGDMIRNAHLLGFFRRITKLLFLRAKPIFVFDGGTPALKKRTVIARRRQRENAQSKIRKTAEKLLLNQLRARKIEEISQNSSATELNPKKQKKGGPGRPRRHIKEGLNDSSTMNLPSTEAQLEAQQYDTSEAGALLRVSEDVETDRPSMDVDALLAASLAAESEGEEPWKNVEMAAQSSDGSDEEQLLLPASDGQVDPAVLASLPPSMQLDLLVQMREQLVAENRQRFQKVAKAPASFSELQIQAYLKTVAFRREINQVQKSAASGGIAGMPSSRIVF